MAQGPVAKVPLGSAGGSSGNVRADLKAVAAEIRSIQSEIATAAKAGKVLDREQVERLRKAQEFQRNLKTGSGAFSDDARTLQKSLKLASAVERAKSAQYLLSGAAFSNPAAAVGAGIDVLRNKKIRAALDAIGLRGVASGLANVAPLA